MKVVSQVFRAVAAMTVVRSATLTSPASLAITVAGGILRYPARMMPGAAACITTVAIYSATPPVKKMVSQFVASGIKTLCPIGVWGEDPANFF